MIMATPKSLIARLYSKTLITILLEVQEKYVFSISLFMLLGILSHYFLKYAALQNQRQVNFLDRWRILFFSNEVQRLAKLRFNAY